MCVSRSARPRGSVQHVTTEELWVCVGVLLQVTEKILARLSMLAKVSFHCIVLFSRGLRNSLNFTTRCVSEKLKTNIQLETYLQSSLGVGLPV